MPALPALEAIPGHDAEVHPAGGASGPHGIGGVLPQAGQEIEQAVAETLDTDPNQRASTMRQLVNKDKQRIKGAVQNATKARQNASGQVKDRLSKGQQQLEQAITDSISKGGEAVEHAINNSIDDQLRRLGGLESAPAKDPK
jgi:membrane protein required for colicin V production